MATVQRVQRRHVQLAEDELEVLGRIPLTLRPTQVLLPTLHQWVTVVGRVVTVHQGAL